MGIFFHSCQVLRKKSDASSEQKQELEYDNFNFRNPTRVRRYIKGVEAVTETIKKMSFREHSLNACSSVSMVIRLCNGFFVCNGIFLLYWTCSIQGFSNVTILPPVGFKQNNNVLTPAGAHSVFLFRSSFHDFSVTGVTYIPHCPRLTPPTSSPQN